MKKEFFKKVFFSEQFFGLDINNYEVKLFCVERLKEGERIICWGKKKFPPETIDSSSIKNKEKFIETIRALIDDARGKKIKLNRVVVTMPEDKIFLRVLKTPRMEESELEESIKWEIEENLPVTLDKIYYDWKIVEKTESSTKVLLVASVRTMVDDLLEAIETAGFNVCAIEADSLANARSILSKKEKKPILLADIGIEGTSYFIYDKGYPVFSSSSSISGKNFTDLLVKSYGVSWEKAESYKRKKGLGGTQEERAEMHRIFSPVLNSLVQEIERTANFYNEQLASNNIKLKKIMLCGGGSNLRGLSSFLEVKLKDFSIQLANPWENVKLKEGVPPISLEDAQSYVTAIGLALRSCQNENDISLLPPEKKRELRNILAIRAIIRSGFVIISALFVLYFFMFFCQRVVEIEKEAIDREINKFKTDGSYSLVIKNQQYIKDLHSKEKKIEKRIGEKKERSVIVNQVNGVIPEDVYLEELLIAERVDNEKEMELILRGIAENREVVIVLKENLEKSGDFRDVEAPISNFVSSKNVNFEFKAKINQK